MPATHPSRRMAMSTDRPTNQTYPKLPSQLEFTKDLIDESQLDHKVHARFLDEKLSGHGTGFRLGRAPLCSPVIAEISYLRFTPPRAATKHRSNSGAIWVAGTWIYVMDFQRMRASIIGGSWHRATCLNSEKTEGRLKAGKESGLLKAVFAKHGKQ